MPDIPVKPPLNFPHPISTNQIVRNPYDISTWGTECGRGIAYAEIGKQITSVLENATGRKRKGNRK
jgi:hypothetical protein